MRKTAAVLLLCLTPLVGGWDYHFKPKVDRAAGQLSYSGALSFSTSSNFVAFGSTSLVVDAEVNLSATPSNSTFQVLADGYYELDLLATWEGPAADIYYSAFSLNGAPLPAGQSREHIKNSNDDAHLSAHILRYLKKDDRVGVMVRSDNEQGGVLYGYVFTVTKY